jgi:subtilisin family serine protease
MMTRNETETETRTRQKVLAILGISLVTVAFIAAYVFATAGFVFFRRPSPKPTPPSPISYDTDDRFAPGQVLVKFRTGADVDRVVSEVLAPPQEVLFNAETRKVVSEKDAPIVLSSSSPKRLELISVQPTLKEVRQLPTRRTFEQLAQQFPNRTQRAPTPIEHRNDEGEWRLVILNETNVDVPALVEAFSGRPEVFAASANGIETADFLPNDYYYNTDLRSPPIHSWGQSYPDLWGMKRIDIEGALDLETGDPSVAIAVVDTGVDYQHEDLAGHAWTNSGETPGNGFDDDGNGFIDDYYGYDFINLDGNPMDDQMHGTHVAGTALGKTNNTVGVASVCGNCSVMAVKGLDCLGSGTDFSVAAAIRYATNMGADVINMSLGGGDYPVVAEEIANASAAGVILVASAGNSGTTIPRYPAAYPGVTAVSAVQYYSTAPPVFTNHGDWIDIAAPGVDILSLRAQAADISRYGHYFVPLNDPNARYMHLTGTSMAAPHVAGLAGLVLSHLPSSTADDVDRFVKIAAEGIYAPGNDEYSGFGLIDASATIAFTDSYQSDLLPELLPLDVRATLVEDQIQITASIRNLGFASTPVPVTVRVESGSTTYATVVTPAPLGTDESYPLDVTFTGPSDIAYDVRVDPDQVIAEYRDDNNTVGVSTEIAKLAGWPQQLAGDGFVSPVLQDLDQDGGDFEIVAADLSGQVTVYEPDGSIRVGWPQQLSDDVYASPVVGDLDPSFPGLEIVVATLHGEYYAFHEDGSILTGWPVVYFENIPMGQRVYAHGDPSLSDIDNDGRLEVFGVVETLNFPAPGQTTTQEYLLVLRGNGQGQPGWNVPQEFVLCTDGKCSSSSAPSIADVHPSYPGKEVFVGCQNGNVYAWRADGTTLPGWPQNVGSGYSIEHSSVALADIDSGSPGLEIIISMAQTVMPYYGKVDARRADGTRISGWPRFVRYPNGCPAASSPAVADIKPTWSGNPWIGPEIVGACQYGWFTMFATQSTSFQRLLLRSGYDSWSSPAVADLDDDGILEIIIGPTDDGYLYAVRWDGSVHPGFPVKTGASDTYAKSSPSIADINGDGTLEIAVETMDPKLFIWTMPTVSSADRAPWPMFHQNMERTGYYPFTPMTPSASATVTAPTNGETVTGTISLRARIDIVGPLVVDHVQFYVGGLDAGEGGAIICQESEISLCYSRSFDTTNLPNGSVAIYARVYTTDGNYSTSDPVAVLVSNPTPTLPPPPGGKFPIEMPPEP